MSYVCLDQLIWLGLLPAFKSNGFLSRLVSKKPKAKKTRYLD